jgi:hypothetical protein
MYMPKRPKLHFVLYNILLANQTPYKQFSDMTHIMSRMQCQDRISACIDKADIVIKLSNAIRRSGFVPEQYKSAFNQFIAWLQKYQPIPTKYLKLELWDANVIRIFNDDYDDIEREYDQLPIAEVIHMMLVNWLQNNQGPIPAVVLRSTSKKSGLVKNINTDKTARTIKKRNKRNKKLAVSTPHKEPEFAQMTLAQATPDIQAKPLIVNAHALIKTSKFKYQYLVGTNAEVDKKLGNHDIIFHDQLDTITDDFQERITTKMKDKVGKHIRHLNNGFTYKPNNEVELDEIIAIYATAHE